MNVKLVLSTAALAFIIALPTVALAQHRGGGRVGGHVIVQHGAPGGHYYHGGARIYSRPYYGLHHYYGRPHYRSHYRPGFFYPRYFYGGLALGLFVASLPLYYDTIWWHGVPYYYSEGTYYLYNDRARKYEVVEPPSNEDAVQPSQASTQELFVYPKEGQSEEKAKTDRFECHQWAADQTGFDPSNGAPAETDKQADYRRAEAACLSGRGYSVK